MDRNTLKILKKVYNNGQMMNVSDRRSPLVNGTPEQQESYQYLLQGGYIRVDKNHGMIYTTISGKEYVDIHKRYKLSLYISIATLVISFINAIVSICKLFP